MKIKKMIFIIPLLLLAACNQSTSVSSSFDSSSSSPSSNSSQNDTITLDALITLLEGDIYKNEVFNSNKVVFEEIDKRGDSRIYKERETLTIYNDYTSLAIGEKSNEYNANDATNYSDTYQMINQAITYPNLDNKTIYYRVIDYADGTKNATWQDSAYRLPVVSEGDESENGVNYLLLGSLPGQISKQVSLLSSRFIKTNLTGNPDVMMALPTVSVKKDNSNTIYSINDYKYSYSDDDGSKTEVLIKFAFTINDKNQLTTSDTTYQTSTSSNGETYTENLNDHYEVIYGERVSSTTVSDLINPEDYFLTEVEEVRAYIFNNGDKEYVDVNNLPLGKYVHFEASKYSPSKAVDLEMNPVSSSNNEVIKIDSNVFETVASGEAKLEIESATGVKKTIDVRVNIPPIQSISYVDTYSNIETISESNVVTKYIYTNTNYQNINVTPRPSKALVSDIEIVISDESVLKITKDESLSTLNSLSLKYEVLKNNDAKSVTVTFRLKTNHEIATVITYKIKDRLSQEDFVSKLTSHTYRWDSIYDKGAYSLLNFEADNKGKIQYFNNNGSLGSSTFTYSLTYDKNGVNFKITMTTYYGDYNYDGAEISLDGESLTLSVDVTRFVHTYIMQEGTL